jgi:hypothetical protein
VSCSNIRVQTVSQRPLIWLNILCLDAPIVAITWQWLFARLFGVAVPLGEREALFLTAWLIYLIDRFADSTSLPADVAKAAREEFCCRHKNIWVGLIAVGALLDGGIIVTSVGRKTFFLGIFLGLIAVAYLAINHAFSKLWQAIPLKEIIVGFLFAAGTLLALAPQLALVRPTIVPAAFLFASLCSLNCVSIALWEDDLDRAQHKHSIATGWPRAGKSAQFMLILLATGCALLALVDSHIWALATCLGSSAVFLFALHFLSISRDERVALADLVLLTPLVFFFVEKIL